MPTVPSYNKGQIRETITPVVQQSTTAPIEAFGGGAAAASAGKAAQDYLSQEIDRADQLVTTEVYSRLKSAKNDIIHNPEGGLVSKRGKDAFGAPDDLVPQFDKVVEETTKNLSQSQKDKISKIVASEKIDLNDTITRHMSQERVRYDDETTKTGLLVSRDEAIKNFRDPSKVAAALEDQRALLENQASRNGLGGEWAKAQIGLAASETHTGVLSRMLANGDDLKASAYFQANKEAISGADAIRIERELEEGSLRGASQRGSDNIVRKTQNLSAALTEVRKIEDPKLRDATEQRVKSEFANREAEKRDREERDFLSATNILEKGGTYDSIPPALIARMPLSQRSALRSYMAGGAAQSDPATFYELKTMSANPEMRDKFLQTNLMEYTGKLSKADWKDLVTDQAALRKGDTRTGEKLDGFMADQATYENVATIAGFDKDKETKALFLRSAQKEQATLEKRLGRKATNEEVTAIGDNLIRKVVTDRGAIWNTEKRLFEVGADEKIDVREISDVPPAEVKRIQQYLKANKLVDSDTSILNLYKAKLARMKSGNR